MTAKVRFGWKSAYPRSRGIFGFAFRALPNTCRAAGHKVFEGETVRVTLILSNVRWSAAMPRCRSRCGTLRRRSGLHRLHKRDRSYFFDRRGSKRSLGQELADDALRTVRRRLSGRLLL